MTETETKRILAVLRSVWPDTKIDQHTITAYHWALGERSYQDIEGAAKVWMRTGKFFPKPSELLEILSENKAAGDVVVEAAWGEVIGQASAVGFRGQPTFSHPLIADAVRAIGWRDICMTDYADYGTLRAQFRDSLRGLKNRAVSREQIGTVTLLDALEERTSQRKQISK